MTSFKFFIGLIAFFCLVNLVVSEPDHLLFLSSQPQAYSGIQASKESQVVDIDYDVYVLSIQWGSKSKFYF